jgi:predicted nucleic acid-binding protein
LPRSGFLPSRIQRRRASSSATTGSSTRQATEARSVFSAFPVLRHRSHALRDPAFDIACAHLLGTYDALFAALAILLEVRLVTADRRLHDALTGNPLLADRLLWLPDLAAADGGGR